MRRDYLSRLSRAARWYLPPAEAAEVVEDYQEIVKGRSEEELRRDLGTPRAAMKQLAQPKAYRRWLAVFIVLAVCVVLPAIEPLWQGLFSLSIQLGRPVWFFRVYDSVVPFSGLFFPAGLALALAWFRRNGEKGRRLPKGVLPLLALSLLGIAWVWCFIGGILTERFVLLSVLPRVGPIYTSYLLLWADALAMGAAGLYGLVRARLGDRRWVAVYILGLTGAALALSLHLLMTSMNLDGFTSSWWQPYAARYAVITALGLIGTGAALC